MPAEPAYVPNMTPLMTAEQSLDGEDVVPGFSCVLGSIV